MRTASSPSLPSGLGAARIGLQAGGLDPGDGAGFVLVRRVAGNAGRADDVAIGIADENAARIGNQPAAAGGGQRGEELRRVGGALEQGARAEAHAERPPGFAEGDVEAQDAGLVLALEGDEMAAGVEYGDGQRRAVGVAAFLQRGVDDGAGLGEGENGHDNSTMAQFIRSLILARAARAHSSSKFPPGAPPTPIPPIGSLPAMMVTPPGVKVTLGRLPSDAVVLGFLLTRSKIALVESSFRTGASEAAV